MCEISDGDGGDGGDDGGDSSWQARRMLATSSSGVSCSGGGVLEGGVGDGSPGGVAALDYPGI